MVSRSASAVVQFVDDGARSDALPTIGTWAAGRGYKGNHPRCNIRCELSRFVRQQLACLAFHATDATFNPAGRLGVNSGCAPWAQRGRRDAGLECWLHPMVHLAA